MTTVQQHTQWVQLQLRRAEEAINDRMEFVFCGWTTYGQVAQEVEFQKQRIRDAHFLLLLQSQT